MRWALGVVLAIGACNGRFGLDPVGSEPDDLDRDGIAYDNCREEPNADQVDQDGDGLGDACDPCPLADTQTFTDVDRDKVDDGCDPCLLGRQHDEDGDGLFDACDNCPIVANPDQANEGEDSIGDACELFELTPGTRQSFFDTFAPVDPRWAATGAAWVQEADSTMMPSLTAPAPASPAFRSPDFSATGSAWMIELGVELVMPASRLQVLLDASGSGEAFGCALECIDGTCTVQMTPTSTAGDPFVASGPNMRLRISTRLLKLKRSVVCEVVGLPLENRSLLGVDDEEFGLSLSSSTNVRIHYLYVQE